LAPRHRTTLELELTSNVRVSGMPAALDLQIKGDLQATALAVEGSSGTPAAAFWFQMPAAQVSSRQATDADLTELRRALERGFVLELASTGPMIRVPAEASEFLRNIALTLAAQLSLDEASATAFKKREQDSAGSYQAEYRLISPGRLTKRKLAYDTLQLAGTNTLGISVTLTPQVINAEGTLDFSDGALRELQYREELETKLLTSGQAVATTSLKLSRKSMAPLKALPRHREVAREMTELRHSGARTPSEHAELLRARVGDFTFESALNELHSLTQPGAPLLVANPEQESASARAAREQRLSQYNRAFSALSAILSSDTDSVERAVAAAERSAGDASFLIDALGAAESETAQHALLRLAESTTAPQSIRERASNGLGRLKHPSAEVVHALIRWTGEDSPRGTAAIYALGTLARQVRERGQTQLVLQAARALAEGLGRSDSTIRRVHFLRGIANSGDVSLLSSVRPLLEHSEPSIRGAAVEAVRLMPGAEADRVIAERLQREGDYSALRAAVNATKTRLPSAFLAAALADLTGRTQDSQARYRAVLVLTDWLPRVPEIGETLRSVASSDPSPDVRSIAAAALEKA
jgi:hypothetical protein